jgi:hypothetical protein
MAEGAAAAERMLETLPERSWATREACSCLREAILDFSSAEDLVESRYLAGEPCVFSGDLTGLRSERTHWCRCQANGNRQSSSDAGLRVS